MGQAPEVGQQAVEHGAGRSSSGPVSVLPRGDEPEGTLGGPRYEPVRALGEGAFGEVSLVRDNDIARLVACKRPKQARTAGLSRFVDEIKAVGQLEHPGIVPIHDVGNDDRGLFYIMKYVEGDTLERVIARLSQGDEATLRRFSFEARAVLFQKLLEAVQFAHERGFIHRDIKPENIIVGRFGEVVLMDWGLAKRVGEASSEGGEAAGVGARQSETRADDVVGTPAYMSPEQARGEPADARSDVYALAAVFYELMTLHHYLTPKPTTEALLVGVMTEEPLSAIAMHHRFGIPPEFTFFLRKGLEKDPAKRHQSVGEMAAALRQILDGHVPVQCPCTGLKNATGRWSHFIDAHPIGSICTALGATALSVYGAVCLALRVAAMLG